MISYEILDARALGHRVEAEQPRPDPTSVIGLLDADLLKRFCHSDRRIGVDLVESRAVRLDGSDPTHSVEDPRKRTTLSHR